MKTELYDNNGNLLVTEYLGSLEEFKALKKQYINSSCSNAILQECDEFTQINMANGLIEVEQEIKYKKHIQDCRAKAKNLRLLVDKATSFDEVNDVPVWENSDA